MQCQCEQGPKASGRRPEAVAIVRGVVAHHTLVVQFGWIAGIFVNIDATAMVLCSVVGYVATRQGDVAIVDIDATTGGSSVAVDVTVLEVDCSVLNVLNERAATIGSSVAVNITRVKGGGTTIDYNASAVIRCVGVDVAVLEVDRTRRDVDATASSIGSSVAVNITRVKGGGATIDHNASTIFTMATGDVDSTD